MFKINTWGIYIVDPPYTLEIIPEINCSKKMGSFFKNKLVNITGSLCSFSL
jgi:hypothetical protein